MQHKSCPIRKIDSEMKKIALDLPALLEGSVLIIEETFNVN
jgi:hypothetical protein